MPSRRDAGALGVLLAHVALFVMAPPVFDYLQISPNRAWGPFRTLSAWDRSIRGPVVNQMRPVEALLGVRQNWHFYTTGASRTRHFEVWVDGELWHRSNDPEHDFMAGPLANSRLRHHVKDWVRGKRVGQNQPALLNLMVERVRAEKPDAERVELRGLEGRWPGHVQDIVRRASADIPPEAP